MKLHGESQKRSSTSRRSTKPLGKHKSEKPSGAVLPSTEEYSCQVAPRYLTLAAGTEVPSSYLRWVLDTELHRVQFQNLPAEERGGWIRAALDLAGRSYQRLLHRAVEQARSELSVESAAEPEFKEMVREALYHAVEQHEYALYHSTVDLSLFHDVFWPAARGHLRRSLNLPCVNAPDDFAYASWFSNLVFGA